MSINEWNENVTEQWNKMAANWQASSEEMWERGSRKTILPLFGRYVQPEQGPVLDAGCAAGYASFKLAERGYTVEGVDISSDMIQLANQLSAPGLPVRFQTGDVNQLLFADQTFAAIISINVVEFTQAPLDPLREFYRLLKPEGILLLGILGPTAGPRAFSYPRLYGEEAIQNTMMPWEAKQLAQENGFLCLKEEPVYRDGVPSELADKLSPELQQALSFLTIFVMKKTSKRSKKETSALG